jgi:recombination protein RecA
MGAAAELRRQIESALAERIPAALSFRPPLSPELLPCGLAEVDAVLGGGLPLGGITELTGAHSSGRTTLTLSTLAEITQRGESCAYVDVSDALDPISASALGVDLRRLLWIRTGEPRPDGRDGWPIQAPPLGLSGAVDLSGGGWPIPAPLSGLSGAVEHPRHPRNEAVGMHRAVGELFHSAHQERVDFTPRCSESIRRERVRPVVFAPMVSNPVVSAPKPIAHRQPAPRPRNVNSRREVSWTRLDQALRATDLLLSTGGFRAIVLDMADVPPEQARRVPLATWYRFRLQVEKSRTLFLLLTRIPCANSCAAVSLHCQPGAVHWQRAAENSPCLLAGLRYRLSVERSRAVDPTRKKPAASAETAWSSTTSWSR